MLECWRTDWRKMMTFELMKRRWKIARIEMRRRRTVVGVAGSGMTWPV